MGQDNPILLVGLTAAAVVAAKWWLEDCRAAARGHPAPRPFPGATWASGSAVTIAATGALVLLAGETLGELQCGLTAAQSHMTGLFALYTLAAGFIEELIFRGFLVVENRGRTALVTGIVGASLLFALIHPFLWEWKEGALVWHLDAKGWFSTAMVLAASLWFYAVRFLPNNPSRSLLPCIAAHVAKNAGVIAVKYAQGFLAGWW